MDTMKFPYKFIVLTTIVSSIVLLLLCEHCGASPSVAPKKCTSDYECDQGQFCRQRLGASYCAPCLDCNQYNREPSRRCAKLRTDCGPCLPGFGELGVHCSRIIKENVATSATDQTPDHYQVTTEDQTEISSVWLLACLSAIFAVVVMTIGTLVYTRRRNVDGNEPLVLKNQLNCDKRATIKSKTNVWQRITDVPEDKMKLAPYCPSTSGTPNLPKDADSFEGLPEASADSHILRSLKSIRRVPNEPPAENLNIPKRHNLLQRANSLDFVLDCKTSAFFANSDDLSSSAPSAYEEDFPFNCNIVTPGSYLVHIANINVSSVDDDNNGDHEALLELLENEIGRRQFEPDPQRQVPNDINDLDELNEDAVNLEQDIRNDINGHPNAIDGDHENRHVMNNNNNHGRLDMDDNDVRNAPQDLLDQEHGFQFEINLDLGGLLRAPFPDVDEDDPMNAVGPEADQVVPDFPPMDNFRQNALPVPRDQQQLAEELRETYGVEMFNNAPEE